MPEITYKYRLNQLLFDLPKSKNTEWVIAELEKEGISRRSLFRDKSIRIDVSAAIPGDRLLIYAKFFDVTVDELFNYSKKIKPASQRKVKKAA